MIVSVGIDLHKRYSQLAAKDTAGNLVAQERIENEPEAFKEFFAQFEQSQAVIEATANWPWLVDLLENQGVKTFLSHPYETKAIAKVRLKKTDKVDANILADLLRTDFLPTSYQATREERDLRELLRFRMALVKVKTQMKNRVHAILAKHNIKFEGTDLFGKRGRAFLNQLVFPEQTDWVLKQALGQIDQLEEVIANFGQRIEQKAEQDQQAKLFLSIPGMGKLTALFLSVELGKITRFNNPKQLAAYVGLCPSTYQSGGKTRYGKIAKTGNPLVRWALIEAAHRAIRADPFLKGVLTRLTLRTGSKKKAIVAVARRIATSMYYMVQRNQVYQIRAAKKKKSNSPELTG